MSLETIFYTVILLELLIPPVVSFFLLSDIKRSKQGTASSPFLAHPLRTLLRVSILAYAVLSAWLLIVIYNAPITIAPFKSLAVMIYVSVYLPIISLLSIGLASFSLKHHIRKHRSGQKNKYILISGIMPVLWILLFLTLSFVFLLKLGEMSTGADYHFDEKPLFNES